MINELLSTTSVRLQDRMRFMRALPWARFWKLVRVLLVCAFIVVFIPASTPPPGDLYTTAASYARDNLFNYVAWEVDALLSKALTRLLGVQDYLSESGRSDLTRAYMTNLAELHQIEAQITDIYSNPNIPDPEAASAELRRERDARRAELHDRQNAVEHILETQISAVLADEGLAFLGQVLPPVAARFSPLPDVLIISPRDEIRVAASISLEGLPDDRRSALESAVDADLETASLVVDIGGMALYPSMVGETSSLPWSIETFAHEWVHHYLFFYPLGLNYFDSGNPETRIINETTADILGKEISREVLRRYYPELAPPEPEPDVSPQPIQPADPAAFNYTAAMHETRVTVDELLAAGEIDRAEAYMAERRAFFHENGYPIRKLNQAYFAFFGGYQGEDNAGTAGEDPIGPAIQELRARVELLAEFLAIMRGITTRDALLTAVEARR